MRNFRHPSVCRGCRSRHQRHDGAGRGILEPADIIGPLPRRSRRQRSAFMAQQLRRGLQAGTAAQEWLGCRQKRQPMDPSYLPGVLDAGGSLPWIDGGEVRDACVDLPERCREAVERLMSAFRRCDYILLLRPSEILCKIAQGEFVLERKSGEWSRGHPPFEPSHAAPGRLSPGAVFRSYP